MGSRPWRIWYDDQCEVCQAGLAWLRRLDGGAGRVEAIALSDLREPAAGAPRPRAASDDDLLRHLHAERPDGAVLVGAPAVAALARHTPGRAGSGGSPTCPGSARWPPRSTAGSPGTATA